MYNFREQIQAAETRYEKHTKQRQDRQKSLDAGDWREVEDPRRVVNRMQRLGLDELMTDLIASPERPEINLLERIINESELQGVEFLIRGARVSRSVGRVVIRNRRQGPARGYGTGFLVSPRLLLTNNHVLESPLAAQFSSIQFNYYEKSGSILTTPVEFELVPQQFFQTNAHLDFTLVAVEPANSSGVTAASLGWNPLIAESGKTLVGERINIIQHPGGEPQQIALRQNKIVDLLDDFLHYSADTRRGSSGSPVYNDNWEVSALHHAGVPKRDAQERILLISGDPWDGSDNTISLIDWEANEGVRISRIVAFLQERADTFSGAENRLFQQAFEAPTESETLATAAQSSTQLASDRVGAGPVIDAQGHAVWTVPLHIRLAVGDTLPINVPDPAPQAPPSVTFPTLPVSPTPISKDDPELQSLLANASQFANRPYYDEETDCANRDDYYERINLDRQPATIFRNLGKLVTESHSPITSYKKARLEYLYPWVDLREDDDGVRNLQSIYSTIKFQPEEIIREDLQITNERMARIQEMIAVEGFVGDESEMLAALERSNPFNCEHVVPQSWFHRETIKRADLHHLFTCESGCNSFRSNIPYFQFPPENEVFRNECGRRMTTERQFEPVAGKGAVARATLYFLLRYPGQIGDSAREMQRDRLDVLLSWHRDHPVSLYEKHRNAAIFEIQGNRNPFIDLPEWAFKVDFEQGFG